MPVHVIGQINIKNMDKWLEYKNQVQKTLEPFGATVLVRGHKVDSFVGETHYPEVVVIAFDSLELAQEWYHSEAYQSIVATRKKGADIILHVYE